jgi:signal transduction histidine kinase
MRFRLPLWPSTINGQITWIIILGLLIVIVGGPRLERVVRADDDISDIERMSTRVHAISDLLASTASDDRHIIMDAAKRDGLHLELMPLSALASFKSSSSAESTLQVILEWIFPPDDIPVPLQGWRTFLDDQRVIAAKIDDETMIVLSELPKTFFWSDDVLGRGSNYLVALLTLIGLFSAFAVWAITLPLRRIAAAAINADASTGPPIFEERGSVEIIALARALNDMRSRISDMVEGRTRMLRGISHDLRTPLTRMRLRVERVADAGLRHALLKDIEQTDRLLSESLNYLRDDFKREALERADIASVVRTICDEFQDIGHCIDYAGPNRLVANFKPIALNRAISNLCENGVKFGTEVQVGLSSKDGLITIEVADNGPGIPAEFHRKVLEPFFKCDSARTGADKGFGLGLSIVSEIVQAHHGTLDLEDRQPHGLIVCVTIPV